MGVARGESGVPRTTSILEQTFFIKDRIKEQYTVRTITQKRAICNLFIHQRLVASKTTKRQSINTTEAKAE